MPIISPLEAMSPEEKEKQTHTPTPWTLSPFGRWRRGVDVLAGNRIIAKCSPMCGSDASSLGNAKFITRACNSHDELLAALWQCQKCFRVLSDHPAFGGGAPEFNVAYETIGRLTSAIAKAEPQ